MTIKATMKLTSRGRVTLPRAVRERLGLRPGDAVELLEDDGGFRMQKDCLCSPFDEYVGFLKELEGCDPDELIEGMRGR